MESSKTDPVLSFVVTPESNMLPDVTSNSAVLKLTPDQMQETVDKDYVTSEPVNTEETACTSGQAIVTSDKTPPCKSNTDDDITQENIQL